MVLVEVYDQVGLGYRAVLGAGRGDREKAAAARRWLAQYVQYAADLGDDQVVAATINQLLPLRIPSSGHVDVFLLARSGDEKVKLPSIARELDAAGPGVRIVGLVEEKPNADLVNYQDLLSDAGFRLIEGKDYLDFGSFRRECGVLGRLVLEPYATPSLIAEARLRNEGFDYARP